MHFKMLILFALLTNLSQAFSQEADPFLVRTNELLQRFDQNTARIVSARHHHYDATDLLMNFMAIRPNNINQDGYQNNVEQSQKPIRDIEDANEKLTTQKQLRLELKDDLELYLSETDGPFNAADIRKEVSRLVELQDELIGTTHAYLSDKAYVFDPLQKRAGTAPAQPFVRRRMVDNEQAIGRIKGEIEQSFGKIVEMQNEKRPPTLKERAYSCWQSVVGALVPAK